jgi:hypothetical protein
MQYGWITVKGLLFAPEKISKTLYPEIFLVSGNGFKSACIRIEVKMQKLSVENGW